MSKLLVKNPEYANFGFMGPMSAGGAANSIKNKLGNMAAGKGAVGLYSKVGKVGSFIGANKGKVGLATAGIAGAGLLASKLLKKKPDTLQSKIKKTIQNNPLLSQASQMFR